MKCVNEIRLTMAVLAFTARAMLTIGCSKKEGTAGGAVVGGTTGALVGYGAASAGSKGAGAVVGGVAGAIVGGLIGNALGDNGEKDEAE